MNATQLYRTASLAAGLTAAAAAYGVICYGQGETVDAVGANNEETHQACRDLGAPPPDSEDTGMTCWYVFCNTAEACSGGQPKYQAWKRFRHIWINPDVYPYAFASGPPSDVPYGCCDCTPGYSQVVPPVG